MLHVCVWDGISCEEGMHMFHGEQTRIEYSYRSYLKLFMEGCRLGKTCFHGLHSHDESLDSDGHN